MILLQLLSLSEPADQRRVASRAGVNTLSPVGERSTAVRERERSLEASRTPRAGPLPWKKGAGRCEPAARKRWMVPIALVAIAASARYVRSGEASPVSIDRSLVRVIAEAHTRLRAAVQCCSGTIEYQRQKLDVPDGRSGDAETMPEQRRRFAVCGANARLEYLPWSDAQSELNPSRVLIQRADAAYDYIVSDASPTGIATLYKYDDHREPRVVNTLTSQLIRPLRSLYQVGDAAVIDYLQRPEVEIVRMPYREVADALWIRGLHRSEAGEDTNYVIVLDPAADFAVVYAEAESTGGESTGRIRHEITPALTPGGAWVPQQIKVAAETRIQRPNDDAALKYQEAFQLLVEPQEDIPRHLFDEAWFRRLGRTFVVMHVAVDGSTRMGNATASASPHRRANRQPASSETVEQSGGLRGVLLLLNGLALLVIAVVVTFRWRRNQRSPSR